LGLLLAIHGYQKFAGGLGGVAAFFEVVTSISTVNRHATTRVATMPGQGWNASDLDRMLLVACALFILAGPGAAALDRIWWEREG